MYGVHPPSHLDGGQASGASAVPFFGGRRRSRGWGGQRKRWLGRSGDALVRRLVVESLRYLGVLGVGSVNGPG